MRLARCRSVSSTELVQEDETAEENGEGNPEVEVGRDGAKQSARIVGFAGSHASSEWSLLNLECHLRERWGGSQR